MTFGFCLAAALLAGIIFHVTFENPSAPPPGLTQWVVDEDAARIVSEIKANGRKLDKPQSLAKLWSGQVSYPQERVYIVAYDGTVIAKSANAELNEIDIYEVLLAKARDDFPQINVRLGGEQEYSASYSPGEYVTYRSILPLKTEDFKGYVYVYGEALPQVYYGGNNSSGFFGLILGVATFFLLFFYLTRKDLRYLEEISAGLKQIAGGNLSFTITKRSNDELGALADNINFMTTQLRETLEAERKAERSKNELVTNVSHDLRTPLTSIIGYLGLLSEGKYENEEQAKSFLAIANRKALRLKSLIEALFEYTKLNCGDIGLKFAEVDIGELIGQLIEENEPLFKEYEVVVKLTAPKWKILVSADGDKLVRVFDNLLSNAVKYGHAGKLVRVAVADEGDWVSVKVVNYGERIPAEDLPYIFERFYRVEKSRSGETGGTGLGLAITKQIVDLHGGVIFAESNEEETSFTVKLKKLR